MTGITGGLVQLSVIVPGDAGAQISRFGPEVGRTTFGALGGICAGVAGVGAGST